MTIYNKNGYLYLNFMLDGKRKRKALRMEDTSANRKIVKKEIIPQLQKKIALGEYGQEETKKPKTFGYYAEIWEKEKASLRSYWTKKYMYEKVITFFKNEYVKDITRLSVKNYINNLTVKTNEVKGKYLSVIRGILELAVDDRELDHNVALGITFNKRQKLNEIDFFEKEEVSKLLSDHEDQELQLYLQIGFTTGMRPEEILALKHSDINDGFVTIQRTKVNGIISKFTKTSGSRRTIPFDIDISMLHNKSFYLFPNIKGTDSLRKRWSKLLKKHNLHHRGIRNTRHTFATHLLKDNIVTISELSGLLGHTKVSTTLKYYASVIDAKDVNVAKKLKNLSYEKCHHSVTQEKSLNVING